MMLTTSNLPDNCPFSEEHDEVDEMICALAAEKGLPYGINPDIVGPDPDAHGFWGAGQEERHRQSVEWRVRLFHELRSRPEWISEWRAAKALDERIRALCEAQGLRFMPWEVPPWRVADDGPCPEWAIGTPWGASWAPAQRLRRQLIAELEGQR